MEFEIKKMESDEEIRGKAFVHYQSWHQAYPGLISQDYLDSFTLDKCEKNAFLWRDNLIVAKADQKVVGFVGYGLNDGPENENGEIYALYILSDYYGTGLGKQLMETGLKQLENCLKIHLWVLKGNERAIHFYKKCGFEFTGEEKYLSGLNASEIGMILTK